jgi:hypothetical protein
VLPPRWHWYGYEPLPAGGGVLGAGPALVGDDSGSVESCVDVDVPDITPQAVRAAAVRAAVLAWQRWHESVKKREG